MNINDLINELNSLTVMDALKLSRELERRWGVSSAIKITIFNPEKDKPVEQQEEFDVVFMDCGSKKIEVIKVLRQLIPGLGLKEAKDISESRDYFLFRHVGRNFAYGIKEQLEKAGATVEVE